MGDHVRLFHVVLLPMYLGCRYKDYSIDNIITVNSIYFNKYTKRTCTRTKRARARAQYNLYIVINLPVNKH